MSGWSAVVWALAAWRRPWWACAVAAGTAAALMRTLRDVPAAESVRLTLLGHLAAGRQLAKATTRVWWPIAMMLLVVPRRMRPDLRLVVAGWIGASVAGTGRAGVRDLPLLLADEMAYGLGVWLGVVEQHDAGPLLPELTTWPRRGDG